MSLQVTVNHEDLVAAWMRAGSLSHLFMVLLDVLLQTNQKKTLTVKDGRRRKFIQDLSFFTHSCDYYF